jgi:hypothetical protein
MLHLRKTSIAYGSVVHMYRYTLLLRKGREIFVFALRPYLQEKISEISFFKLNSSLKNRSNVQISPEIL